MELLFILFLLKHFVVDFPLQAKYQFENKGKYGHPGGIIHAMLHMVGTFAITLLMSLSILNCFIVALIDGITHYHIDWAKVNTNKYFGFDYYHKHFWNLIGLDQLFHYLVYMGLIAFFF